MTWRSQIQCLRCLGVSDTFDPYLDISLDITAAQSVEQALSGNFVGRIKGAKCPFDLQFLTWDFP